MKLATLRNGRRDGTLVVVSRDLTRAVRAEHIAPTLQAALDDWEECAPRLNGLYGQLNEEAFPEQLGSADLWESSAVILHGADCPPSFPLDVCQLMAPLPRAYQWADASAYLSHVERARKARGAAMPPGAHEEPLMYQGGSDSMLGACDQIPIADVAWGIDLEGELAVITGDVPIGTSHIDAQRYVRLLALVNDISLRFLTPVELAKGFGFFYSKSWTAFSPVAVTPDELGEAWDGRRVHLPLLVNLNGERLGQPDAGRDMDFDFTRLIEHASKTRPLGAGTIIGSGTVSNKDAAVGFACLTEKRAVEIVESGSPSTPFLNYGDRITIEMLGSDGKSIFGAIDQVVVPLKSGAMTGP